MPDDPFATAAPLSRFTGALLWWRICRVHGHHYPYDGPSICLSCDRPWFFKIVRRADV